MIKIFNLQLFATQTTLLNASGNDLSPEMKIYYDKELIEQAEPYLVHNQFGQKRPIPKNGGKTIEFRKFSSLPKATTPLVEGVTPTGNVLDVSAITATVNQYGDYIQQSDILEMTAIDNTILEATRLTGSQSGRTLDTVTRNIINGGTNVLYAEGSTRAGLDGDSVITLDKVFEAAAILKANNAPTIDGSYVAIIHPYVSYDLMIAAKSAGTWIDVQKYANPEAIFNGEIGKVGGVRFVETTEAKIFYGTADDCAADTPVFSTLILGKDAYGVIEVEGGGLESIVKQKGYGDDPLNQRSSVGWKATATAARLVEEYMVRLESGSSLGSKVTAAN